MARKDVWGKVSNLSDAVNDLERQMLEAVHDMVRKTGEAVIEEAQNNLERNGSIDTGNLLKSFYITEDVVKDEDDGHYFVIVGNMADYAEYVEFGTGVHNQRYSVPADYSWSFQDETGKWWHMRGARPKPFMRPAIEKVLSEAFLGNSVALNGFDTEGG